MALFNADMDRRLTDLTAGLEAGQLIKVNFEPRFGNKKGGNVRQPDRIKVTCGERRLIFSLEMADAVAAQLNENGHEDAAKLIWGATPGLK